MRTIIIRLVPILSFLTCALLSIMLGLYLIVLGMAPGVPPLNLTGVFLYGPGPGFFLLVLWWVLASGVYAAAWLAGWLGGAALRVRGTTTAWAILAGLLALQLVMLADFNGLL